MGYRGWTALNQCFARNPFLSQRQNVRLRGAVRLRRKWRTTPRVEVHIDAHIGRGHNAATHSFLSAIVKAVLADWPGWQ
jgi:hypothetical protein